MLQALKNALRLRLRGPLAELARRLPLSFMPRQNLGNAIDVEGRDVTVDAMSASRVTVPPLPEPHEREYRALLADGQRLHEADIPVRIAVEVRDAVVAMPESIALRRGRILRESLPHDHALDTVLFLKDWFRPRPEGTIGAKAGFLLTIPLARNYHLWVHYALPRLLFWERLPDRGDVAILIPEDAPGFVTGALEIYRRGFPELKVEVVPRSRATVERLIVAEPMSVEDLPNPQAVDWLRRTFVPEPVEATRSILVSRKAALEREVLNENELFESLAPLGFERFDPGRASFAEQIQVFSTASRIVAPHGAALANLAFAPAGAHVVEIVGGSHFFGCFRFLAAEIGAHYDAVAGTTQGPHLTVDATQRAEIVRLLEADEGSLKGVEAQ